mmetsp:Transcript_1132/g.4051  ORF Transcript_1132/g.4051 Transcript_1132/m.4051 type:complete len:209 (-) Transcript_1132:80-706(-)
MEPLARLVTVRRTVFEMLADRGYNVFDAEKQLTEAVFKEKHPQAVHDREAGDLTIFRSKVDDPTDLVCVFWPNEMKVGKDRLDRYVEQMQSTNANRGIIILRGTMSVFAQRAIAQLAEVRTKLFLEYFREEELLVNITRHRLVPHHEVLNPEEKVQLLTKYKLDESQLPSMLTNDAVARYLGLRKGEIVKIVRNSETAGKYISYRRVV